MTDHDTCPEYHLSEFGTSEARKRLADEETYPMLRRLVQDLDRQLAAEREKNERLCVALEPFARWANCEEVKSAQADKAASYHVAGPLIWIRWSEIHAAAEAIAGAQEPQP